MSTKWSLLSDLEQHVLDVDEGGDVLVEHHGVLVLAALVLPSYTPPVGRPDSTTDRHLITSHHQH